MDEEEKQEKLQKRIRKITTFLIIVIISILIIVLGNKKFKLERQENINYIKAEITSVFINEDEELNNIIKEENKEDKSKSNYVMKDINFEAKITENGEMKDKTVFARQIIHESMPKKIVEEGDKILLVKTEGSEIYSFVEYDQSIKVLILVIILLVLTVIIGLWKGFNTIAALILNALIIFLVYIPSIINGTNIYLSTILFSIYVVTSGLILLNGINKKTFAAIIGNFIGVGVAAILAVILNKIFMITGIIDQESIFLKMINEEKTIDLVGIIWAGIVIGALGAIMDTAMSVSSTITEVSNNMEKKDFKTLFNSGMTVGRDAIGTMTNTLVLAYIGGAISMTILHVATSKDYLYIINSEPIIIEILQAIIGSLGILITVPATVLIATLFEIREKKEGRKFIQKYSEGLSFNFKKK